MSGSNIAGIAVPDPDLFHPDPYIRRGVGWGGGGGWSPKKLFCFGPSGRSLVYK